MSLSPTERLERAKRDEIRAEGQKQATRDFNRMVADTGACLSEIARRCGRASSAIDRWASMASPQVPTDADIQRMPAICRRWYANRTAAALDCMVVELPAQPDVRMLNDLKLAASAQRECGEAIAALLEEVATGHMVRAKGAELVRECNEAIAALLAIRFRGEQAQAEGVIGTVVPLKEGA